MKKRTGQAETTALPEKREVAAELRRLNQRKKCLQAFCATVCTLIVAAAMTVLLVTMFLPVVRVSGRSMEPMLLDGDVVILLEGRSFDVGDVVGFYYQNKLLLKRIIAGPGDIVRIDGDGNVYVNEEFLDETYVENKALGKSDWEYPYEVAEDCYFVMGDNRAISIDSRSSEIGCIDADQIMGKVLFCIWPVSRIRILS